MHMQIDENAHLYDCIPTSSGQVAAGVCCPSRGMITACVFQQTYTIAALTCAQPVKTGVQTAGSTSETRYYYDVASGSINNQAIVIN